MNTWPYWHLVLLVLLFVLYFLPTIIALLGRSRLTVPLVLVNLFLGWTLIGWVVALVGIVKLFENACGAVDMSGLVGER